MGVGETEGLPRIIDRENIEVKVNGEVKKITIDKSKNKLIQNHINSIMNKNRCEDIFVDIIH